LDLINLKRYFPLSKKFCQNEEEIVKVIMDNPNAYEYDELYESFQNKRADMLDQKKSDRSSRYFDKARANAERGKIEKDVVREKMAAKVLMREGGKLDSDEQYLTSSYLDMLKKNQAWQAEDAQRENYNERNSVKNTVSLTKNL
jgi:coiled-coil domain-containing protein 55